MSIQMAPNQIQKESIQKEELKQSGLKEESERNSKAINLSNTAEIICSNPVSRSSNIKNTIQPNKIDTRPVFDQYIPEKSDEQKSYGHYKLVSDEQGNQKILFSKPAKNSDESSKGIPATEAPDIENADSISKDSSKIQKLKKKRQQLKQQILSETDPGKTEQLKKKLAQIELQ